MEGPMRNQACDLLYSFLSCRHPQRIRLNEKVEYIEFTGAGGWGAILRRADSCCPSYDGQRWNEPALFCVPVEWLSKELMSEDGDWQAADVERPAFIIREPK
jgi:hypothetical protein